MAQPDPPMQHESFIFKDVEEHHILQLRAQAKVRRVKAGAHLFYEGEEANQFYELLIGKISLYRLSPEGEERIFQQVDRGGTLAESAMFMTPNTYPLTAKAEENCELMVYSREALLQLCAEHQDFSLQILSALSMRLHQTINRIDQLTLKNAGQRLVTYLLEQHRQQHSDWLTLPVSHATLAGQLNIAPETLSRLLQRMRQAEVISGKRHTVVLLNVSKMCEMVNLPYVVANGVQHQMMNEEQLSMAGCCNLKRI